MCQFFFAKRAVSVDNLTQTGSSAVRTFHGIVVEALDSNACVVGSSPSWSPGVRSSLVPDG